MTETLCLALFGNSHDIEDLLQDVYIRILEAEKITSITTPKAFIYKVARNLALNEKSKASQKLCATFDDEELEQMLISMSLEDKIEQEQRYVHFCSSINKLPPQCRKVFIMKKVHGLSNSEIAQTLDISISTVDKHLAKGLITCKSDLQRLGHFAAPIARVNTKLVNPKNTTRIITVADSCNS